MKRRHFDAVIIGAGPSGSSTAILLARAGWSVVLVEKDPFPRRKVCGECVAASNLPLLDTLGIGRAFDAAAGPALRRVAFMHRDDTVEADLPAAADARHCWGRALGRETLDSLLLAAARTAGAVVLQPCSVRTLAGSPGDWRCEVQDLASGSTSALRACVAIDAHGSWETLRSTREAERRSRRPSDLLAFKANFRDASLAAGLLPVVSVDGGYGGMVVADRGLTTIACCIRRDRLEDCRSASPGMRAGDAVDAYLRSECRGVRMALRAATREGPWLAAGPLNPGIRVEPDDGPFRVGNAAGEAHPIIGEGMSMALQSAWLLCTHLLDADRARQALGIAGQREVGHRYAREWRSQFAPRLRLASVFAHAAMRPAAAASLTALGHAWPGLLTLGAELAGKTRSPSAAQPDCAPRSTSHTSSDAYSKDMP